MSREAVESGFNLMAFLDKALRKLVNMPFNPSTIRVEKVADHQDPTPS